MYQKVLNTWAEYKRLLAPSIHYSARVEQKNSKNEFILGNVASTLTAMKDDH